MTMTPNNRRLDNEYHEMRELADASSLFSFVARGIPPTRYDVTFTCTSLFADGQALIYRDLHRFTLQLDSGFPLMPPLVTWMTPIFHPNFAAPEVCTGDIWFAGMSLAEFCEQLFDLVQYKSFNIYDPLDRMAAAWLARELMIGQQNIPVDTRNIRDAHSVPVQRPATVSEFELDLRPAGES